MKRKIEKALKEAEKKNKKIYGIVPKYKLIICKNKKEYEKQLKKKNPVSKATSEKGKIIMLEPSKQDFDYRFIIYHEMNHVAFMEITNIKKPEWLMEGLAFLNQHYYRPKKSWKEYLKKINAEEYLLANAKKLKSVEERNKFYILSYFCIKYLERKYGVIKLRNFLPKIRAPYQDKTFWKAFKNHFKLSKKELIDLSLR